MKIVYFFVLFLSLSTVTLVDYTAPVEGAKSADIYMNYSTESAIASETLPDWAVYDTTICSTGSEVQANDIHGMASKLFLLANPASDNDGNPMMKTMKFFTQEYSWHLSPYGFLSPTNGAMCGFFCKDVYFNTMYGYYNFEPEHNPNDSLNHFSGAYFGLGGDWPMIGLFVSQLSYSNADSHICYAISTESITVEFSNLVLANVDTSEKLTAQVKLLSDGTVIMRYNSVPDWTAGRSDSFPPSVGLVFTKSLRTVVDTPNKYNQIVGYRFKPVQDPCSSNSNQESCLASGCAWCILSAACASDVTQTALCPSTSIINSTTQEQVFYEVSLKEEVSLSGPVSGTTFNWKDTPITLNLGFEFDFLGQKVSTLYLLEPSVLSLTPTQDCNPLWNTCSNGNYTFAILPFQTAMYWTDSTVILGGKIAERSAPSYLCDSGTCPQGYVLQVYHSFPYSFSQFSPPFSVTYQVLLSEGGEINVVYGRDGPDVAMGSPIFAYPSSLIGVVRYTSSDPSSTLIPNQLIYHGTSMTLTPKNSVCGDCGLHGTCRNGACWCHTGFAGATCNECKAEYYGPECTSCSPFCGGNCDSGKSGTGACLDTPCGSCDFNNAVCLSGRCVCNKGWTGSSCSEKVDMCRQYTFDGCPPCAYESGCQYCYDYTCFNPLDSGTPDGYSCSYTISSFQSIACQFVVQHGEAAFDKGIVVVVCLAVLVGLLLTTAIFNISFLYHRRRIADVHVRAAIGGSTTMMPSRRERSIIPINLIHKKTVSDEQYVMGLPLQQVPLRTLYERRYEEEKN